MVLLGGTLRKQSLDSVMYHSIHLFGVQRAWSSSRCVLTLLRYDGIVVARLSSLISMAHLWRPANKTYLRWIMKTTTRIFTITQYMQVLWNPLVCFILLATNSNLCTRGSAELQMFALIRDPACLWGLNCFQHELHSIPKKKYTNCIARFFVMGH